MIIQQRHLFISISYIPPLSHNRRFPLKLTLGQSQCVMRRRHSVLCKTIFTPELSARLCVHSTVCPPSALPPDRMLASDWPRGRNTQFWLVERPGKGWPPIGGGRCNCRARPLLSNRGRPCLQERQPLVSQFLAPYLIRLLILPILWRWPNIVWDVNISDIKKMLSKLRNLCHLKCPAIKCFVQTRRSSEIWSTLPRTRNMRGPAYQSKK